MNAECSGCGVTAADLPYEEMGLTLDEASEFLFDDGLCRGCVTPPAETAPCAVCPECVAGKHGNCDGTAWDHDADIATSCTCPDGEHR